MKLSRWAWPVLIATALIGVALVGRQHQSPRAAQPVACANPVAGCAFTHRGRAAQLRFSHSPTALQPFTITLHAANAQRVEAAFQMQGMDMGFNRYTFARNPAGEFVAQITLPVCVSGRRDWQLQLRIDAQVYTIPFSTS